MLDDISFLPQLVSGSDTVVKVYDQGGIRCLSLALSVEYIMFAGRSGACLSLQISTVIVFFHVCSLESRERVATT
jgi:hypothetical protein